MSYETKTPLALLFLVVSFLFVTMLLHSLSGNLLATPLAFGKVINKLVFDNQPVTEVVFVGDVLLARDVERKLTVFGQNYPFAAFADMFSDKFVFGNFEAVVPEIHQPTPDFNTQFSVKTDNLESVVNAKFTHWSLANNHSNDFGETGYQNTLNELSLRGFTPFGHPNQIASSSVTEILVNRQRIAVIGINAVSAPPEGKSLKQLIESTKNQNDFVIVYIHWGDEYQVVHNSSQEKLAHLMIDNGVDLIVGHHPHVVQDIELYKNHLIFYSLGNFLFDQYFSPEVQQGLMLNFRPESKKILISLIPVSSIDSKIQPQPLAGEDKSQFLFDLAERSSLSLKKAISKGEIAIEF